MSYAYNSLGMRTVMTDGTGSTLYSYDSLNRLTSVQNGVGGTVGYGYDLASRITTLTYPSNGNAGSGTRTVTRQYDDANRVTRVTDWLNRATQFSYNVEGDLTTATYPNGVYSNVGYNAANQVISMTHSLATTPSTPSASFLSFDYTRNPVGVLQSANEGTQGTHGYGYDALYRLTTDQLSSSSSITSTWGYDAATQITQTSYTPGGSNPTTTTRTYNSANQILTLVETLNAQTTKNIAFTFDNNGNRTQQSDSVSGGKSKTYTYDQADRLTNLVPDSTQALTHYTYAYNGDGLRTTKGSCPSGGSCTSQYFTWDIAEGLPLLLQDGSASYVYGPGGMVLEQIPTSATTPSTPVTWTNLVGTTASGNTLTKPSNGTAHWNAGGTSNEKIATGDGSVQVTADVTNTLKMFGLADNETTASYDDIDYAFYMYNTGALYVYQAGVNKGQYGTYSPGDTLTVAIEGGVVKYYRNDTPVYTSTVTPVYPLFMDAAIFTPGALLQDAVIGYGQVRWTNQVGTTASGNTLTKPTSGTAHWNAGANSSQKVTSGDGYVQVTADVTNTLKMFGLADNETSSGYDDIDYAFYMYSNGSLYVYQAGVNKGLVGTYLPGDTLTVAIEAGVVKYYRNAALLYTSTVTPVYPLFMDSAIFTPGALLQDAIIGKGQQPVYYHPDQLGSTRATSGAFGQVVNAYTYDAYGNTTSSTGTAFVYNPFKYAGEYVDGESGLIYLRARYYDPASQQFLSVDPLLAWTEQAYAYVGGSPTNAADPSGLWAVGVCRGGAANAFLGMAIMDCLVMTSSGEIGEQITLNDMASSNLSASATGTFFVSKEAETLKDMEGAFAGGGVSGGPEIFSLGVDVSGGKNAQGDTIGCMAYQVGVGPSLFPIGVQGSVGVTWTVHDYSPWARTMVTQLKQVHDQVQEAWSQIAYGPNAWWWNLTHPGSPAFQWWNPFSWMK